MKAILTKLDNGYTLTVMSEEERQLEDQPGRPVIKEEKKQRLVFESKEAAIARITEVM